MTSTRLPGLIIFVAACLLGAPLPARATAIAHSELDFKNLAITPAAGTFSFDGPWFLQAFAHADNSLGESKNGSADSFSPDSISASAEVTWAKAAGSVSAPNDLPDLAVTGSASSDVNIPGCGPAAAFSKGRGTLFNFFTITGGGPTVNVTFEIDVAGLLKVMTDACGKLARTETVFSLEVDGAVVLFDGGPERILEIGPSDEDELPFSRHLTKTVALAPLDSKGLPLSHFLLLEADSESRGLVPEPLGYTLLVAGLLALVATRRNPLLLALNK